MKIKQKFRKVMTTLLSVAMIMTLCVGLNFGVVTVEATGYSRQTWNITTSDDGTIQSVNFQFQTSDTAPGTWYLYLWDKNDTSGTNGRPQILSSTSQTTSDGSHSMTINFEGSHGKEYLIGMVLKDSQYSTGNTSGSEYSDWPYLTSVCDMVDCDDEKLAGTVYINGKPVSGSVSDSLKTEEKPSESTDEEDFTSDTVLMEDVITSVDEETGVITISNIFAKNGGKLYYGVMSVPDLPESDVDTLNAEISEKISPDNVFVNRLEEIDGSSVTITMTENAPYMVMLCEVHDINVIEDSNGVSKFASRVINLYFANGNDSAGEEEEEDTPTGATYTFSYAYDCQRKPAFPKKGDSVTMSGFKGPRTGTSFDDSAIAAGWSLVSDGKYNSSTHTELSDLVNKLKSNGYSVDAADMEVYNLVRKDTDTVVATGFIFATMGSDGLLYISSNNYGYYICDKALTNNDKVTATADGDISDPAIPGGEEPPHVCEFGDWVITKEATAEADGEKERKCECGKTETAVVKFVPVADENTGILTEDTKPEDNACNADIKIDVEDIITDIGLTDEEILKIENGEDISVYLEVENADDTVDDGDKTATEDALTANTKVGMYLNINLLKKIGNNNPTAITETEQPITITFVVPDKLINTDTSKTRTYKIIRVHNGIAKVLDCSFNPATKTASFETDKFSSYAIAYVDKIDRGNNSGSTGGNSGGNTTPTTPEKDDDKDNDYDGGDISAGASVELDETMLEIGSAFESDVTVYITFTMFTLSVAYAIFKKIFKKKKHE